MGRRGSGSRVDRKGSGGRNGNRGQRIFYGTLLGRVNILTSKDLMPYYLSRGNSIVLNGLLRRSLRRVLSSPHTRTVARNFGRRATARTLYRGYRSTFMEGDFQKGTEGWRGVWGRRRVG